MYPLWATTLLVDNLIASNAPANTPLHIYYDKAGRRRAVSSAIIKSLLCLSALTIQGHDGVDPQNIAVHSI